MQTAVDFITPTLNRPDVHADLYRSFASQQLRDKRLFVLDESPAASPFFSGLNDPRVTYAHEPSAQITAAGQGGIARARNRLLRMTSAPVVASLDDDDEYFPAYGPEMLRRLGGNDLAKLVVWNMKTDDGMFQWDTRRFTGRVFAVKGGEPAQQVDVDKTIDPQIRRDMADAWMIGFGFSYVFRRALWEKTPFDETEQTEDIPWIRACRAAGAKIVLVSDLPHLALHTVHTRSESVNFPQRRIAGLPQGMTELPPGKPIAIAPGRSYTILARLKNKHPAATLARRAAAWGVALTSVEDGAKPEEFSVAAAPSGYRLVLISGSASKAGTLPWNVPSPLSVFDKSGVVRGWVR